MDIQALKTEKEKVLASLKESIKQMDEEYSLITKNYNERRDAILTEAVEVQGQVRLLAGMLTPTKAEPAAATA